LNITYAYRFKSDFDDYVILAPKYRKFKQSEYFFNNFGDEMALIAFSMAGAIACIYLDLNYLDKKKNVIFGEIYIIFVFNALYHFIFAFNLRAWFFVFLQVRFRGDS
jgi:hypothetical protein